MNPGWSFDRSGLIATRRAAARAARAAAPLLCRVVLALSGAFFPAAAGRAQTLKNDREQGRIMLGVIKNEIKKNYYDPTFRGIDVESRFRKADEDIKNAASLNEVLGIISDTLLEFKDSHTVFIPPRRAARVEYGWYMQLIGDKTYIDAVKPGSDAEAKGLRPGDRVMTVDGYRISTRASMTRFEYVYNALSPRPSVRLSIEKPDGKQIQLNIVSKVYEGRVITNLTPGVATDLFNIIRDFENDMRFNRHRYYDINNEFFVWKMPEFGSPDVVNEIMDKARKRKALVLDLRGNPGGAIETLQRLTGYFFDREVKIGEMKRRKEIRPLVARAVGERAFKGQLVVLVDSNSGSSAELLARVVQLEKRGVVVGDRTAGAVMVSVRHIYQLGTGLVVNYGLSVTDADIIMTDGTSLERVGVSPDVLMLPTAADLASGRDPALARACQLVGLNITPEKAGTMFPVEWRPM